MQGTTDALIEAGRSAENGDDGYLEIVSQISERHGKALNKIFAGKTHSVLSVFVDTAIQEPLR